MIRAEDPRALGEVDRLLDQHDDIGPVALACRRGDDLVDVGLRDVAYQLPSELRQYQPLCAILVISDRRRRELRLVDVVDHAPPDFAEGRQAPARIDSHVFAPPGADDDLLRARRAPGPA